MKPFRRSKRYVGDRPETGASPCAHPGCTEAGVYRAPRDRALREYVWLCLEHVRAYNQSWDYYRGMSQAEIEMELRLDTVWQRPTWRLGDKAASATREHKARPRFNDRFFVFEDDLGETKSKRAKPAGPPGSPAHAMEILGVEHPLTRQALKMRYHELVKQHHPDRHGGDKAAEERLKIINEAHAILLKHLDAGARKTAV